MNTLNPPPFFARITFNPHSTFSSINPRASFEFKIFPQQALDSRRGMGGMESNERRDSASRWHRSLYPIPNRFLVYCLPYPQLPSDNEAFSRNLFLEISRRTGNQSTRVNDISNTLEKTVNICLDPVEEVCKCCLWKLQLSKLHGIWKSLNIYISEVRKLLYRSLTTIYPTVKLITQA